MSREDGNRRNDTYYDTNKPVVTSDIMIFLGPVLFSLCMCYMCIDYWLLRRTNVDSQISNYETAKQAPDKQFWVISLPPSKLKLSPRAHTAGSGGNLEYQELSLAKDCDVSKGSEESRRICAPGSLPKLLIPSYDDDVSTSHISLTSIRSTRVDSSTVKVLKGAQHVRAPSKVRSYMLSQPIQPSGSLERECDGSPLQQADCKALNHCPTETSKTLTLEGELGVDIVPSVKFLTRTLCLKQFTPSDGSLPITVQQVSKSGSYKIIQLPVNNAPMQNDGWVSPDEFKILETIESWKKSEIAIDISAQVEPSITHSITFLKTSMDKAQNDSKDHGFVPDHQNNAEKDQYKLKHKHNKPTQESLLIMGSAVFNSKILNSGTPVSHLKFNGSAHSVEEEHREKEALSEEDDGMTSEASSYLVPLVARGVDPDNNAKNPILN